MEKELTPLEKWNSLTLANNFIFCKVLEENPDVCKELLEMLLDIKIDRIEQPKSEQTFKTDFDSRGIRLDVYVKDGTGRCFDIEIQTSNYMQLAKRARYYQGLMDVDSIQFGQEYSALKDSYVIFLCLGDAFGHRLPVYTFRYRAEEDKNILMNDGTVNIFFNATMYDKMQSENLRSFFKYLCGKNSDDNFTDRLSALVERVKMNAQWRHRYMTIEQEIKLQVEARTKERLNELAKDIAKDMAQDIAKDMAQDIANEKTIETAKKMIAANLGTVEQIASVTGLSLEQITKLKTGEN
ncbi:Rpn family recombination-promoting nuclease/putative transposase [uncultured Treponema sp.]|uniref:Rpn family recombination-promoting nuclease/putative transposase n=1 Tax=uncultured Treponema sp. TaxID=162155 RepID=UPI002589AA57|nr:Rpn family recombination-promoting nuclease/putative transposase [uncultured Treponema sp.]